MFWINEEKKLPIPRTLLGALIFDIWYWYLIFSSLKINIHPGLKMSNKKYPMNGIESQLQIAQITHIWRYVKGVISQLSYKLPLLHGHTLYNSQPASLVYLLSVHLWPCQSTLSYFLLSSAILFLHIWLFSPICSIVSLWLQSEENCIFPFWFCNG